MSPTFFSFLCSLFCLHKFCSHDEPKQVLQFLLLLYSLRFKVTTVGQYSCMLYIYINIKNHHLGTPDKPILLHSPQQMLYGVDAKCSSNMLVIHSSDLSSKTPPGYTFTLLICTQRSPHSFTELHICSLSHFSLFCRVSVIHFHTSGLNPCGREQTIKN